MPMRVISSPPPHHNRVPRDPRNPRVRVRVLRVLRGPFRGPCAAARLLPPASAARRRRLRTQERPFAVPPRFIGCALIAGGVMVARRLVYAAAAVIALCAMVAPAAAQTTGTIVGTVKDPQGGVVPGAAVTLTSDSR